MKLVSKKLSLAVATAALVFAGCTKKPIRPDPSVTAMGLTPGGGNIDTQLTGADLGSPAGTTLTDRPAGFGVDGQNRDLLKQHTVYFEFNSSNIRASERSKLQAAKDYLDKNPTHRLLLEGHCDWRGTAEYNLSLGDRRANAAKAYLQTLGVAPDRLETLSKGSLEASKNADEATMRQDRRVDVVVVDPGAVAAKAGPGPL